ncbi:MAG: hypothetical protein O3A47_06385 [Chloroflexi bacterium]|nr:hypothetical protein [Chloroflexota bacterium]
MGKVGGGGLVLAGILIIFLGFLIKSDITESLLELTGRVVIIGGAVVGIIGLVKMFSGGGKGGGSSDDF